MKKSKFVFFLFAVIQSICFGQTQMPNQFEMGLRLGSVYKNAISEGLFFHDYGVLLFDGFILKMQRLKYTYRFQFNYHTSKQNIYPYYEVLPPAIKYNNIKIIDFAIGAQRAIKRSHFYMFGDTYYAFRSKMGLVYGRNVALFSLNLKRQEIGANGGIGFHQKIGSIFIVSAECKLNAFWQSIKYSISNLSIVEVQEGLKRRFNASIGAQVFLTMQLK